MRRSLAAAALAILAVIPAAQAQDLAAGDYGGELLIGFDPATRTVTGYFQSFTGDRQQFSCIFYFSGTLRGRQAPVRSYFPATPAEAIAGTLTRDTDGGIAVRLAEEHGGCWNVQHFADDTQPAAFALAAAHPWLAIAVVKSPKAYFFDRAGAPAPRKAYVVRGDGLGIRAVRDGWLQVDFTGGARPISGWIRQADVYPAR
ncbi:hypothetical protein [Sphingomonas sp. KR3-1]|uniref:hypothetical protein n=1 Tax=Sphingomonas sp. KR3-1 TaxID=3156611 RepID=UPI0032B56D61